MTGADLLALIKKHPVAFAAGLIAVACTGWWYAHSEAVSDARTKFEAKATEARKMGDNIRHASLLEDQAAAMKEAGRQFESRLVRAGQLATNLQFFYRLENETGVKLLDARQQQLPAPKANAPRTAFVGVPFAVSVQGTHAQVLAFIRRIEAGPHFGRFTQLTISKAAAARGDTTAAPDALSATFTVELLGTP